MVFNSEKLNVDIGLHSDELKILQEKGRKAPKNVILLHKLERTMQLVATLSDLRAVHQAIDDGQTGAWPSISRNGDFEEAIKVVGNCEKDIQFLQYIDLSTLVEVSLIVSQFDTQEYAIMMVFTGKHGSIAFVRETYAELSAVYVSCRVEQRVKSKNIEQILTGYLVDGKQCANAFVFRSSPLYFNTQEIELRTLIAKVDRFLRKKVGFNGRYVAWQNPNISKIFLMAEPGWWINI